LGGKGLSPQEKKKKGGESSLYKEGMVWHPHFRERVGSKIEEGKKGYCFLGGEEKEKRVVFPPGGGEVSHIWEENSTVVQKEERRVFPRERKGEQEKKEGLKKRG